MAKDPKASRTRERGDRRKEAILASAVRLFGERGYQGTSLDDVAGEVGITRAGVLHHYGSKQELLWAVLEERDRAGDQRVLPAISGGDLGFLDGFVEIMRSNQREAPLVQLYVLLLAEGVTGDHPAHDHFATRYRILGRRVVQMLRADQVAGRIRTDVDLDTLEPVLGAAVDGLLVRFLYDPSVDLVASYSMFVAAMRSYLTFHDGATQTDRPVSNDLADRLAVSTSVD